MKEWKIEKLGKLVTFSSGGTPSKQNDAYWNGSIPWISAKTMKSDRISTSGLFISEEGLANGSKLANEGSLLLLVRGSGLFNGIPICYVESPVAYNQDVKCINSCSEIENEFIYYWIKANSDFLQAKLDVTGIGAGKFDTKFLADLDVAYPDKQTRKKIIEFANNITDKLQVNEAINRNLSEQMISTFKSWFIDFDPFGGEIPSEWEVLRFEDFITLRNEKSNDDSIPMYAVTDTGIYPRDEKFKKNLSKAGSTFKVVRKTNLVFGMSREILNWGILNDEIAGVSSAYTVYAIDSKIKPLYLEYYIKLRTDYFREIIRLASREGQGIDRGVLLKKELYVPNKEWMSKFTQLSKVLLDKIEEVNAENEQLESIRDSLLPKLMSGELDVTDLDA